jgi:hypothetical protein
MTLAKIKTEYLEAISKQAIPARFMELKNQIKVLEAELKAISDKVINSPDQYPMFNVVRSTRSYVPIDTIKAYVGEEWYTQNTIISATKPYIRLK